MKILRRLKVPTGDILVVQGEKGKLEMLSLGDYGKHTNIKADFLGLSRDIERVTHREMLPLEEKWVITVSTQYGCSMGCNFCDVPKVGPGVNATTDDLVNQVWTGLFLHPGIERTKRLNVHFARMGEPTWNPNVLHATELLEMQIDHRRALFHPVVSTMMPNGNKNLRDFLYKWVEIKNGLLHGEAGLQLSVNGTNEAERDEMFGGSACTLENCSRLMQGLKPEGRKFTLNFAVAEYEIDPDVLLKYFDPEHYIIKLTPMHKTQSAVDNRIETCGNYTEYHPYKEHEERLRKAGYDVLVFIASEEEDLGRITCGNAILSGTQPLVEFEEVQHG